MHFAWFAYWNSLSIFTLLEFILPLISVWLNLTEQNNWPLLEQAGIQKYHRKVYCPFSDFYSIPLPTFVNFLLRSHKTITLWQNRLKKDGKTFCPTFNKPRGFGSWNFHSPQIQNILVFTLIWLDIPAAVNSSFWAKESVFCINLAWRRHH